MFLFLRGFGVFYIPVYARLRAAELFHGELHRAAQLEHALVVELCDDLRALRNVDMVVARGTIIDHPKVKKKKQVEAELDKFL